MIPQVIKTDARDRLADSGECRLHVERDTRQSGLDVRGERLRGLRPTPFTHRTLVRRDDLVEAIDAARRAGFALVDQELEIGLRSLAAPIHDARVQVVAAVNISTNASAVASEPVPDLYRDALAATAAAIRADLVATALD